jgi:hypothetical protein
MSCPISRKPVLDIGAPVMPMRKTDSVGSTFYEAAGPVAGSVVAFLLFDIHGRCVEGAEDNDTAASVDAGMTFRLTEVLLIGVLCMAAGCLINMWQYRSQGDETLLALRKAEKSSRQVCV